MPDDDKIRFQCPHCEKGLNVSSAHAGKKAKCPGCGKPVTVPEPVEEIDFETLMDRSMNELQLKTEAHTNTWGLGSCDRWDMDQETGIITFTTKKMIATAPAQIIGTYSLESGTWLWGWDHPSVVEGLAEHAKQVYEFGQANGIDHLTNRKIECDEDVCWGFTALACHLCDAQGAYRGPAGNALVFMTFGNVTLNKR